MCWHEFLSGPHFSESETMGGVATSVKRQGLDFSSCGAFTRLDRGRLRWNAVCMDETPKHDTPPPIPPDDNPGARQWITILHISALAGFVLVGFGQILGPLLVWLLKKNEVPGLDAAGRDVLNFQISWTLWWALSWVFVAVGWCLIIPLAVPLVLLAAWVVFGILGAIKASDGVPYRFPLTIRFLN